MNTPTKKLAKALVDQWSRSPDEGYSVYYGMIEECLMDLERKTETADFFKATEVEMRKVMGEAPAGLIGSYNDFITALHDHKAVWL